jgi:DNA-directed RNA polymerase specialized sigma24 family protein
MHLPDETPSSPSVGSSPGPTSGEAARFWQEAIRFATNEAVSHLGRCNLRDAEEIAQDAVSRMWEKSPQFTVGWKAWLRTSVANRVKNYYRNAATRRKYVSPNTDAAFGATASKDRPPVDQLAEDEILAQLPAILEEIGQQFGRETRAIVDLRALKRPWSEVVLAVGACERTCRDRLEAVRVWLLTRLSLQKTRGGRHDE